MWKRWIPWRFLIRHVARGQGFIDPIALISQLQRFAQPAEVAAPIELLRQSAVLQARGLMNLQAIQHNLDWIWPHWVVHQFNPRDKGFVPRAFSLTHINLTHRNWTAVGLPHLDKYSIVDPRGLLTPHYDGWSLDAWLIREKGSHIVPSLAGLPVQRMTTQGNLAIETSWRDPGGRLHMRTETFEHEGVPYCRLLVSGHSLERAWIALSLRPHNPEGVNLVHDISLSEDKKGWLVNKKDHVYFSDLPDRHAFSDYARGDVYAGLPADSPEQKISCGVGMASAAALFEIPARQTREISACVPLIKEKDAGKNIVFSVPASAEAAWQSAMSGSARLSVPDPLYQYLYDTAVRTVLLHSPLEVYPGPYTYKHFWFRDAAIIMHSLLCLGLFGRTERILDTFPDKQTVTGYFRSQEGEWDSNGQVIWLFRRYQELTGKPMKDEWRSSITKAIKWIQRKRVSEKIDKIHAGLFPAGFSAEHLGPNDFYYWDDFWGVEGLRAGSELAASWGDETHSKEWAEEAKSFMRCIERSLGTAAARLGHKAMPSSPYRRMDTGSIGSMAVDYPLKLWSPGDERMMQTADYLINNCFVDGGFFHDMSHSGINPYLTLHIAQALMRAGDNRSLAIIRRVAELASPTGQWPEAVHPQTLGGCMGDGQHVWAAAEWLIVMRNSFVREEGKKLIIGSGILPEWIEDTAEMSFGPAPTSFGTVTIKISASRGELRVSCIGTWRDKEPEIEIRLPERAPARLQGTEIIFRQPKEFVK